MVAQALAKRVIDAGLSTSLADGLALEREAFVEVFGTDDSQIGVKSFIEHGPGKADVHRALTDDAATSAYTSMVRDAMASQL